MKILLKLVTLVALIVPYLDRWNRRRKVLEQVSQDRFSRKAILRPGLIRSVWRNTTLRMICEEHNVEDALPTTKVGEESLDERGRVE